MGAFDHRFWPAPCRFQAWSWGRWGFLGWFLGSDMILYLRITKHSALEDLEPWQGYGRKARGRGRVEQATRS